jgi:hypothetical protein
VGTESHGSQIDSHAVGNDKESIMGSTISVNRKGADLFFTLEGNFNDNSCQELVDSLTNAVMTLLKCTAPASQVAYTFKTRSKVDIKETVRDN